MNKTLNHKPYWVFAAVIIVLAAFWYIISKFASYSTQSIVSDISITAILIVVCIVLIWSVWGKIFKKGE